MDAGTPSIGWAGTGRMGSAIVKRLARAGVDVTAWNRTRSKAEPLADLGVKIVDDLAELCNLPIVFTMLSTPDAFREVVLGVEGLVGDTAPETIVDSSTISAKASAEVRGALAEVGASLVSAPVSGNPLTVPAGLLTVVASGPRAAYEQALPVLELFGAGVTYVGPGEESRLVKLCHNLFLGIVTEGLVETTILAERGGIGRSDFLRFMNDSVLGSVFTRYKSPAIVNLDYEPTFTARLLRKDLELGLDVAGQLDVPLPLVAAVHEIVVALVAGGYGDVDFAALVELQAQRSGFDLEAEETFVSDGLTER